MLQTLLDGNQDICVGTCIDFLAENLFSAGNGQQGYLIAQGLPGSLGSDVGFAFRSGTRCSDDAGRFGTRLLKDCAP